MYAGCSLDHRVTANDYDRLLPTLLLSTSLDTVVIGTAGEFAMDMSHNVEVYSRVFDAVNEGDESALDDLLTEDVLDHNPIPGQEPGIPGFKQWMRYVRAAFP